MLKDLSAIAEQIGWPLAIGLFLLVVSHKMGLLSIKIGGNEKSVDPVERLTQRMDAQDDEIHELGIKIARIDAVLEDRKTRG